MTLEDYKKYWEENIKVSGETFEGFLYGKILSAKNFIENMNVQFKDFIISNEINLVKNEYSRYESEPQNTDNNDIIDNRQLEKNKILGNIEERMFGKVECTGSCKECKNRDVKSCMISSRFGSEKPSSKQIKYAESIARTLDIPLPICKKKVPYSAFISNNKDKFAYNRATRVWQTDF